VSRLSLAAFWLVAGTMHVLRPQFYRPIVPPPIDRWKNEVVAISGVAELAGGVLVLPERTRRLARWYLLLLLAAVYPANVYMALKPERYKKYGPAAALWGRLPIQFLFAWHAWRGTADQRL
jgi:uncharacterized membrane protein